MPLPDPDYLTDESFYWDGQVFPAALLTADGTVTGEKRLIRWDTLDNIDRPMVHTLIMEYALRNGLSEGTALSLVAAPAFQVVDYDGQLVAGNGAGLASGVEYKATVEVNGVVDQILVIGVPTDTVADVITKINSQITGAAAVFTISVLPVIVGNLELESAVAGNPEIVKVSDNNLFSSIGAGIFVGIKEKRVGVDNTSDVFDLNFRADYQSYASLLIGKLRYIPNKAQRSAKTTNDIYFNHGTGAWLYVATDLITPAP